MRKLALISKGMLFVAVLAGCATSGNPAITDEAVLSQIVIGKTTKDQVRQLLGPPTMTSNTIINGQAHEWWSYGYAKHETNPLLFVPVVGLFVLASDSSGESHSAGFSVTFDQNGIVSGFSKLKTDMQFGLSPTIESHSQTTVGQPPPAEIKSDMKISPP